MKNIKKIIKCMTKEENHCTTKLQTEKAPCNKKAKMQKSLPWSECGSTLCAKNKREWIKSQ